VQGLLQELGIYLLSFDRPGYAESDAHPARTEKSIVLDIEELADNLQLGPKFHLIGYSMGGEIMWSCLKYIPHRWINRADQHSNSSSVLRSEDFQY
jgi:pimeloyl-ACP methyl ester carboxylesterase